MRRLLALAPLVVAMLALAAGTVLAAPTSVATKLQLRGHLPDLGEAPAMWVFTTAASYDSFRVQQDIADVFPDSDSLFMTFDKEILAVYTRGDDTGGRCLRAGPVSGLVGTTVILDLSWDASSCGAPASAHYPFVLTSLSRTADDGSSWLAGRQVCAAAPGVDGSRACAPASGGSASPAPSATPTPAPSATPLPTSSPTPFPTATSSAAQTATPAPTRTASAVPTSARTSSPSPTGTAVVAGTSSGGGSGLLDVAGWLAVGLIVGVFVTALVMRPRVYRL